MTVHRSGTMKIWQSGNEKAEMFCYSMKHQFIAGNSRRGSLFCNRALSAKTFCQNLLHLLRSLSWPGIGSGLFEIAKRGGDQVGRHPQGGEGGGP